jgi:hypothetical protein
MQRMEEELAQRRAIDRKPYFEISDELFVHISRLPVSSDRLNFLKYVQYKASLKEDLMILRNE